MAGILGDISHSNKAAKKLLHLPPEETAVKNIFLASITVLAYTLVVVFV
ncbi:hypothetical protein [[Phormidium] sp. ETS-05]|nr:hypothetical protein [[Phormidium] sp. ETS-05]